MSDFSKTLSHFRRERKMSQEILAKQIDVSPSIIRYWENGQKEPTLSNFIRLAKFFNVTLDEMAGQ